MFFTYHQNNSGGFYRGDYKIVIVEANDEDDANYYAKKYYNVYMNGVSRGIDCSCCGDRWTSPDEYSKPATYGICIDYLEDKIDKYDRYDSVVIRYLDGNEYKLNIPNSFENSWFEEGKVENV